MNTTSSPFPTMAMRDDYFGFGYIGERRNFLDRYLDGDADPDAAAATVAQIDQLILAAAHQAGWDTEQLFTWANSKDGRWFGDIVFGTTGPVADRFAAARYLLR